MNNNPLVSVIIPTYNCISFLEKCLPAVKASNYTNYELIIVDDASTDATPDFVEKAGIRVVRMDKQSGPGAARNVGTQYAKGDIYFFVDSDVEIKPDSISCVVSSFQGNPDAGALFGSYDNQPSEANFCSQYKNLFHHFIHQTSHDEATTFWAGCGAVRKEVFNEVGGFDIIHYKKPSIEDIELGLRISKKGYKILIVKELQAKHLKKWGLKSLIYTDIFCRAVPWATLILKTNDMPKGLNFQRNHMISSLSIGFLIALSIFFMLEYKLFSFVPVGPFFYYVKLGIVGIFIVANLAVFYMRMFQLLDKKRHLKFLLPTIFFIISGFGVSLGAFMFINHKVISFIPNTHFYYQLKLVVLALFFLVNFAIFYKKIPKVETRSLQWNVMIRTLFVAAVCVVVTVSLLLFRYHVGFNLIPSAAASYFTFVLITVNILLLNSRLYRFFFNLKGFKFLLLTIFFHVLYYIYSSGTFAICWCIHFAKKRLH